MPSRRDFLKTSALAAGAILLPRWSARARASSLTPVPTLSPLSIPKYVTPLVIPPVMPQSPGGAPGVDYYEIAVRQFRQQILPPGFPDTTVWSYASLAEPSTLNYPAFTIEAEYNRAVRVRWVNGLVDANGAFLPHLLTVDPTLHWANPPGGVTMRDMCPEFTDTPPPYTGPVPIVTHVHGAHSREDSDGYPTAWFLPVAGNIPAGYATVGSDYERYRLQYTAGHPEAWSPGSAVFEYLNDQRATTLWYHDHTLGMTRLNVYAGPAGFYLLRGGPDDLGEGLPGPAPRPGDAPGTKYYEIPIVIQGRSFNSDGSLFFPTSRAYFDGFEGPYIPFSDVSPYYNSEFFADTVVVNGGTWPYLEVEARRYRFRLLNGCNARTLRLKIVSDPLKRPGHAALPFWQIGADGGFLPKPVNLSSLLLSLAERADVIVDFSRLPAGTELYLINEGPDDPFGGGKTHRRDMADPATTGQIMQFKVVSPTSPDNSIPPHRLALPSLTPLGAAVNTRKLSLNESDSEVLPEVGPTQALLGTLNPDGTPNPLHWSAPVTETPALDSTEMWEIHNFTGDAHPIHVHQVQFQVVNRENHGKIAGPELWETGYKDTVIAYPGSVTRIKARFDLPGQYVWHCHIIDHEDNEMMRPFLVS